MLRKYLCLILLVSVSLSSKELALSFDDSPMRDMPLYSGLERTALLINTLDKHNIKTVFFSVSRNLGKDDGLERMKSYNDAGHFIANHTHAHPNYDQTSAKKYIRNFDQADVLLRQFSNFRAWFRYPMLRHGDTIAKRDTMRAHLRRKKYKNGYVTLDIQDWYMAKLLNKGVSSGRKLNKENMCTAYVEMIWDTIEYYDTKAVELLKRSPKHMLLLHENDLAALCLESLISILKMKKWKIISPEQAMKDEIYAIQPDTLFNNNGQIAALYHAEKGVKLQDPWANPWDGGKQIREEFERRKVFK